MCTNCDDTVERNLILNMQYMFGIGDRIHDGILIENCCIHNLSAIKVRFIFPPIVTNSLILITHIILVSNFPITFVWKYT